MGQRRLTATVAVRFCAAMLRSLVTVLSMVVKRLVSVFWTPSNSCSRVWFSGPKAAMAFCRETLSAV